MRPTATLAHLLRLAIPLLLLAACTREDVSLGSGDLSLERNPGVPQTAPASPAPAPMSPAATSPPAPAPAPAPSPAPPQPTAPPSPPPPTPPPAPPGGPGIACGNAVCAAGSSCCLSRCGVSGEVPQRLAGCAGPGSSCLAPAIVIPCAPCNVDSDCRLADSSCTDPVSSCQCRAFARARPEPSFCTSCDPQACANKVAVCMITQTGGPPVPPPVPGQPPAPPPILGARGICVVRDASAATMP
jgi:hypothetical protein